MKRTFTQMLSLAIVLFGLHNVNAQNQTFTIVAPEELANTYEFGQADWTGSLEVGENLVGNLVLVESNADMDDTYPDDVPTDACVGLINPEEIAGNFALVDRGTCFFSDKVWYAQEAGATAVIICNNQPGAGVIGLATGGDFADLDTIPAGMLNFETCSAIKEVLAAGGTVGVDLGTDVFVDLAGPYTYETPQNNIVPMMGIGVTIYSAEVEPVNITWVITDPNGVETTLTTSGDSNSDGVVFSVDEAYTPEAVGTYTIVATNDINDFMLEEEFIITDSDVFALDNGGETTGIGPANGEGWTTPADGVGYYYDAGMTIRTGAVDVELETLQFGLDNWTEIQTDAASPVEFVVQVYDVDPEMDGVIVDLLTGSEYTDLGDPLGFTIYTATGDEADNDIVTADFNLTSIPFLPAGGMYLVSVQYRGEDVANGISPKYLYAGNLNYLDAMQAPIITNQWYSGWVGSPNIILRATAPKFVSGVTPTLAENAVVVTPNPASSNVNVAIELENTSANVSVIITDVTGRVMTTRQMSNLQTADLSFDIAKYPAGNYFVQVATAEGFSVEKIVKQ